MCESKRGRLAVQQDVLVSLGLCLGPASPSTRRSLDLDCCVLWVHVASTALRHQLGLHLTACRMTTVHRLHAGRGLALLAVAGLGGLATVRALDLCGSVGLVSSWLQWW